MLHTKQFDKKHLGHLTVPQNPTFDRFLPDLAHKKLYSVRGVDFCGKVSGVISIFVYQFLQKRAVSRFWSKSAQNRGGTSGFVVQVHFYVVVFFNFENTFSYVTTWKLHFG